MIKLGDALRSAQAVMTTTPRDWTLDRRDAWLWGLIHGWSDVALVDVAKKHGWDSEDVFRLKRLRAEFARIEAEE